MADRRQPETGDQETQSRRNKGSRREGRWRMPVRRSTSRLEALRRKFLPADLRLLFIGESPPASGRFFYRADSGLYRAMRDAFRMVEPAIDDRNFLAAFQSSGCYLVDLCPHPVDDLERKLRREICRANEGRLAKEIARLQPQVIASLLRSIEDNVIRAVSSADWHGPLIRLPYPGRWSHHRKAFLDALVPRLGRLSGFSLHRADGC